MDRDGWIPLSERRPTAEDGDAQKCVLVWHELSGCLLTGYHNIRNNEFITHWMPLPKRPETACGGGPHDRGEGAAAGDQSEVPGMQRGHEE